MCVCAFVKPIVRMRLNNNIIIIIIIIIYWPDYRTSQNILYDVAFI